MAYEEEQYYQELEARQKALELENSHLKTDNYGKTSIFAGADNSNLIQYQLDLSEEKEKIDHLLRGHVIKTDQKTKREYWDDPDDPTSKSLTNYGVEKLMNIINFYLSRNIILSNYNEKTIDEKMKDIGWEIAGTIFLEYEYVFFKPTYEDLLKRDNNKFNYLKENYEGEVLVNKILEILMEYDAEIENIYKKNCKQYPMILRLLIDSIHSAYNRALGGEERTSLRRVMSVSQTQTDSSFGRPMTRPSEPVKRRTLNPLSWAKG